MSLLHPEFRAAPSEPGTQIVGVHAPPPCAEALVRRLLAESDPALAKLRGVHGPEGIVIAGEGDALPWVDGVVYLRPCVGDGSLWLPSTTRLSVPEDAFAKALRRSLPKLLGTAVLLPDTRSVIPLRDARPLVRAQLEGWP